MTEGECAARLRAISRELDALAAYEARLMAERSGLIRQLTGQHSWSQRQAAAETGISQPRIARLLSARKVTP